MIHSDPSQQQTKDTTSATDWIPMKTFHAVRSGKVRVRWEAHIHSGTYYWAGRFVKNGTLMKKSDGTTDASHHFSTSLASGYSDAVHSYRQFQMDLDDIKPGDVITYQMISSNGSGSPQLGNNQYLRCQRFYVYSTTPTVEPLSPAVTARYEMMQKLVTFNTAGVEASMVYEGAQLTASGSNWSNWNNVPEWAKGMLGTSEINTSDSNSVTLACTMTVFLNRSDGWNTVSTSGWTDLGSGHGIDANGNDATFGPGGHLYVKTFAAGTHTLDNNSAMYLFTI
jgi:hypothetical protein